MHIILIIQLFGIPVLTQISNWVIEQGLICPPFFGIGEYDPVCFIDPAIEAALD